MYVFMYVCMYVCMYVGKSFIGKKHPMSVIGRNFNITRVESALDHGLEWNAGMDTDYCAQARTESNVFVQNLKH